jgi:hypothetical protein
VIRDWQIDPRRVPLSLWAFDGVLVIGAFMIFVRSSVPVGPIVFGVFFVSAWSYLLLKGIRWIWLATVTIYLLNVPWIALGSASWETIVTTMIGLSLLVLPSTRGYFKWPMQSKASG